VARPSYRCVLDGITGRGLYGLLDFGLAFGPQSVKGARFRKRPLQS
jgi:hypothetical protein